MPSVRPIGASEAGASPESLFKDGAAQLVALQDRCASAWHQGPLVTSPGLTCFERVVAEQHLANFALWHAEDSARTPGASDQELAGIKRLIDSTNQRRNDLAEECDALLLAWLAERKLPEPAANLHSESPGLMIDRLSILSLKLYHTREEMERAGAPSGHADLNRQRLLILNEQRADLAGALDRLWRQVLTGQSRFKLYRQLKMYNDPALNPAMYAPRRRSSC